MLGGREQGIEVVGCLGGCRRGRQRWREKWRGGREEREGVGHLSSGESTVWPGRESGPLADKTHTDVQALTYMQVTLHTHINEDIYTEMHILYVETHRCTYRKAH